MRTIVFDGRTGAAGDMICAALLAAGANPDVLAPVSDHLSIRYEIGTTTKNGIRATTVDVLRDDISDDRDGTEDHDHTHSGSREHSHTHADDDDHGREHSHTHDHADDHTHDHADEREHGSSRTHDHGGQADQAEGSGVHRSYPEVIALVESMDLPESVVSVALDAFEYLGVAEASVHGTDLENTHFHEVGADDAIADIVGAALLLDDLEPERVVTTPISAGGGEVEMSHGIYPVPPPATTEILTRADFTVTGGPIDRELLTPTGAAILAAVAEGVDSIPNLVVDASGYGAGDATFKQHPNILRVLIGEAREHGEDGKHDAVGEGSDSGHGAGMHHELVHDDIAMLETNLDDATPEVLGGLQETLERAGARDVTIIPTTMKKSRPGHLVKVLCKPADAEALAERLARETGSLGVRQSGATHRWIAERAFETATLSIDETNYEVSVKVATMVGGDVYDVSAEYDDAAAVAEATGLPIREVLRRAETRVRTDLGV